MAARAGERRDPRHAACSQQWLESAVAASEHAASVPLGAPKHWWKERTMRCEEVMKRDVQCVSSRESVQLAAQRMANGNIGFLPVCDESGVVLGALTDRDLVLRVLAHGRPETTPIADVFTHEVVACHPGDDLFEAQTMMAKHHKSRIMCLDEQNHVVGVISLSDIAQQSSEARAAKTLRQVSEREARA
jgi:CBS domain-containing protein